MPVGWRYRKKRLLLRIFGGPAIQHGRRAVKITDTMPESQLFVRYLDPDAMVDAAFVEIVRLVAETVLAADVLADPKDGLLDPAGGSRTEIASARAASQDLERVVEDQVLHPAHEIDDDRNHVGRNTVAALLLGGGRRGRARHGGTDDDAGRNVAGPMLRLAPEAGREGREPDGVDRHVVQLRRAKALAQADAAAVVLRFRDHDDDLAVVLRSLEEQADRAVHGVRQGHGRGADPHRLEGLIDLLGVVGEILQELDAAIEGQHRRFAVLAQHEFREQVGGLADIAQDALDPIARLDADHHRNRQKTHVEARDRLLDVVVVDREVLLDHVVDIGALGTANRQRHRNLVDLLEEDGRLVGLEERLWIEEVAALLRAERCSGQ